MTIIEANPGESIWRLALRAIDQCNRDQRDYQIRHNGTLVRVHPGSHEYDIGEKWFMQRRLDDHGDN